MTKFEFGKWYPLTEDMPHTVAGEADYKEVLLGRYHERWRQYDRAIGFVIKHSDGELVGRASGFHNVTWTHWTPLPEMDFHNENETTGTAKPG